MIPPAQREIAAFLQSLSGARPVETHISAVFVGQDTAWKLKKAVAFPFVDLTRPETRKRLALRELELNRAITPEIYHDVAAIVRCVEDGRLSFAPHDTPAALDWVLRMSVIPKESFLDEVAKTGGLTPELCRSTADMVARLHESAEPVHCSAPVARFQKLLASAADGARAAGLDACEVGRWEEECRARLGDVATLLAARADLGFVRRVHGDLHLGNLCLWRGVPVAFDALEFDEELATIDLGYDLAFLLMDVDLRAARPAANAIFNRYIARTGDVALLSLLPLFLSLRAMVRAHVTALAEKAEARTYLGAALSYLVPVSSPVLAIGGLQGTGKSTLARALAPSLGPAPGALVLRSDELRKRLNLVPPEARLPDAAYTQAANRMLENTLLAELRTAADSGHGVIADATFLSAELRDRIENVAAAAHRDFLGLWLEAPLNDLEARLAARRGDASDADIDVLRRAADMDTGCITWSRLDARTPKALRQAACALIPS